MADDRSERFLVQCVRRTEIAFIAECGSVLAISQSCYKIQSYQMADQQLCTTPQQDPSRCLLSLTNLLRNDDASS